MSEEPPLYFWKEAEHEGGFLSPWYKTPFKDGKTTYQSAGHAILAAKARLFGDKEALERILAAETPEEQSTLDTSVKGFDERVWQENALIIAKRANMSKFFDSTEPMSLKDRLLTTRKRELVFASPSDKLLGIGYGAGGAEQTSREKWGQNLFGQSLDAVRQKIVQLADPNFPSMFDRGGDFEVHW